MDNKENLNIRIKKLVSSKIPVKCKCGSKAYIFFSEDGRDNPFRVRCNSTLCELASDWCKTAEGSILGWNYLMRMDQIINILEEDEDDDILVCPKCNTRFTKTSTLGDRNE